MKLMRYWLILVGMYHLIACAPDHEGAELLSVPVKNTQPIVGEDRQYYQDQLRHYRSLEIWSAITQLWGVQFSDARQSAVYVKRRSGHEHIVLDLVLIFDDVPGDDSTSSYYFNMTLKDTGEGLEIIKLEESFRCWSDRGHRDFSLEPCH